MGTLSVSTIEQVRWQTPDEYQLGPNDTHVYQIRISANLKHLDSFQATFTADEKERGRKYHQLKDRQRFAVSRGTQRFILSRHLDIPPQDLTFHMGSNKKPYLQTLQSGPLHYNVSHAGDMVCLAVSRHPVGVDVEFVDQQFQFADIIADNFSSDEAAYIGSTDQVKRFYLLWTRKEAFLKATGQGLGEHLRLAPALDGVHQISSLLTGSNEDWHLNSLAVNDHMISVATMGAAKQLNFFQPVF